MKDLGRLLGCLYNLEHLEHLVLRRVYICRSCTGYQPVPPRLLQLKIQSNLTHLEVEFADVYSSIEFDQFSLPALTHLTIRFCFDFHSIQCWNGCKDHPDLTLLHLREDSFLFDPNAKLFPKLKVLNLRINFQCNLINISLEPILSSLNIFCESRGIEFRVFHEEEKDDTWHVTTRSSIDDQLENYPYPH
ncbi:uncharacterized protein MELLADRAFT_73742 [Melampsora larici-populina 98AG31]|uniref:Uncharacterized protein n=1 Tax=Melampsora larici-populina (strain 98AG31 / pathotype 3-4-7) TaxID=747676 RepID=F4RVP9_MELLP|nr:uncharacterized protein MELLADRAFT_72547 [Melampsora larici-populina 98AG31]XP_007419489.1 uncharacterized protein MELLADRAFT_73742 [Melampsora larici-populina 98AG31]EGF97242.1 hypothetical protein MELLADRAFT_73742 [Melampsora larici-populina 98AG31]EGG03545.1 hypothetical protein MELLADRAFT_72547 [Melampsora larici-populina 98AG31]